MAAAVPPAAWRRRAHQARVADALVRAAWLVARGLRGRFGGVWRVPATILYPSREVRDTVIKSGMEHGAAECYAKLAEVFAAG